MSSAPDLNIVTLKVSEIFFSLQGEASRTGLPTVFIRLAGCPLSCCWCDTGYALSGGVEMSLAEILAATCVHPTRHVSVTGGEPLAQEGCLILLAALCDAGYAVSLETSGALPIHSVDVRVSRIVDLKPPSSGEAEKNHWDNLAGLDARDELKVVIADREDYEWASAIIREKPELALPDFPIWFSPAHNLQDVRALAEWILADGLPVRLQMQLHKAIWGSIRGK